MNKIYDVNVTSCKLISALVEYVINSKWEINVNQLKSNMFLINISSNRGNFKLILINDDNFTTKIIVDDENVHSVLLDILNNISKKYEFLYI